MFIPLETWPVSHQTEKAAVQIARRRLCVPGGFNFLVSVWPVLDPNSRVVFQIVGPTPKFFAVRRPQIFHAGFTAFGVNDLMLLRTGFVKIRFGAIRSEEHTSEL